MQCNLPEHRYKICRSKEERAELPDDSVDVFKRNMLDRYIDRPNKNFVAGKYHALDNMCYAEFLSHYYLAPYVDDETINDNQPNILQEEILENNSNPCGYPSIIPLMS